MPDVSDREHLEKRADVYRALIRQENDITNHRTTWMLVTHGVLFAALATLLKDDRFLLSLAVALVGCLSAWSIGRALRDSERSRTYMKDEWEDRLRRFGYTPYVDFPPLDGGRIPTIYHETPKPKRKWKAARWLFPWRSLPALFCLTWIFVFAYVIYLWLVAC